MKSVNVLLGFFAAIGFMSIGTIAVPISVAKRYSSLFITRCLSDDEPGSVLDRGHGYGDGGDGYGGYGGYGGDYGGYDGYGDDSYDEDDYRLVKR
jgi:hypothetical protein